MAQFLEVLVHIAAISDILRAIKSNQFFSKMSKKTARCQVERTPPMYPINPITTAGLIHRNSGRIINQPELEGHSCGIIQMLRSWVGSRQLFAIGIESFLSTCLYKHTHEKNSVTWIKGTCLVFPLLNSIWGEVGKGLHERAPEIENHSDQRRNHSHGNKLL